MYRLFLLSLLVFSETIFQMSIHISGIVVRSYNVPVLMLRMDNPWDIIPGY